MLLKHKEGNNRMRTQTDETRHPIDFRHKRQLSSVFATLGKGLRVIRADVRTTQVVWQHRFAPKITYQPLKIHMTPS